MRNQEMTVGRAGGTVKPKRRRNDRNGKAVRHTNPYVTHDGVKPHRVERRRRTTLSEAALDTQLKKLLALRARLVGSVSQISDEALSGYGVETTSASPDAADRAIETTEQDLALSLLGTTTGALEQISEALQRIDSGNYGQCRRCGVAIPAARLEAIPYTPYCVQCASRREQKLRG